MPDALPVAAPPRAILLIANPKSRRGREVAGAARAALEAGGGRVAQPDSATSVAAAIRAAAGAVDAVVVAGGDGTLNAAAPTLLETGLPLGIVPAGTANDLARTLGLPSDPAEAARIVLAGATRRIDIGMVNDVPFFNVASIGFGVDLARALTRDSKRRWGVLGYAIAGLRAARRLRPFTAWITHGGVTHVSRTVHVSVGNGRHFGGGMTVAQHARIDDGRLDVFSLETSGALGLLKLLPWLRTGRHHVWEEVRTLAGEVVRVETRHPRSVNTDGEITTRTPALFSVRPAAITVFAPPE